MNGWTTLLCDYLKNIFFFLFSFSKDLILLTYSGISQLPDVKTSMDNILQKCV